MGNYPSFSTQEGLVVGALELNLCYECPLGCCKIGGPWSNCCADTFCPCCQGITSPKGPEWDAAKEGFGIFLSEAATIAFKAGGCCNNPFTIKKALDADWTPRANEYLKGHNLKCEICAFYTSDGKSAHPHVVCQFRKTDHALS